MAVNFTYSPINGINAITINENFRRVQEALEKALGREGDTPNQLEGDIDINGNNVINVGGVYADDYFLNGTSLATRLQDSLDAVAESESSAEAAADSAEQASQFADNAEESADRANTYRDDAADFAGYRQYKDLSTLEAASLSYTDVSVGDVFRTRKERFGYEVAPSILSNPDLVVGNVLFTALPGPDGFVTFRQLGAAGDGVTDDREAFLKALGRKVRAQAGDTYFIDVNSYTDTIQIADDTCWQFPVGCKIEWDYFGAPLFYLPPGVTGVEMDRPEIVWDGDPTGAFPHDVNTLRAYFGTSPNNSSNDFCANWLHVSGGDVVLNRPKCSVKSPGARKSIPNNIRLLPQESLVLGGRLVIRNAEIDDVTMGILGNGTSEVRIEGVTRGGRYDEYNGASGFAESTFNVGHLIYLSGYIDATGSPGIEKLYIGNIYDLGDYQGAVVGGQGSCALKLRNIRDFSIGRVISHRPHGAFDGFGLRNGVCDLIWWRSENGEGADAYSSAEIVRLLSSNGVVGQCENVRFRSIVLDVPAIDRGALNIFGESADYQHTNVIVEHMSLTMDGSALTSGQAGQIINLKDCINSGVQSLDLNIYGTPPNFFPLVRFAGSTEDSFIFARSRGTAKVDLMAQDATSQNNRFHLDPGKDGKVFGSTEAADVNDGGTFMTTPVDAASFELDNYTAEGTTVTATMQLPSRGVYIVNAVGGRIGSEDTRSIMSTFLVRWWDRGGNDEFSDAEKIGADLGVDGVVTAQDATVDQNGLVTISLTMSASGPGVIHGSWARLAALPAA